MIITVTGNLLAERTLTFSEWSAGKTQRATAESFQVGGKGINVAKMLRRLGHPVSAWFFAGGASGDECVSWLDSSGIPYRVFPTKAGTRTGLVARSTNLPETTFLAPDRPADESALNSLASAIEETASITPEVIFALCGSFPGFASPAAEKLRTVLASCAARGALVVDTYGAPLEWAKTQPTPLVKINLHEFNGLFEEQERSIPVLERLALAQQRWPVRAWIITDGSNQICHADAMSRPASLHPPAVKEVSPTGSGDVFFASLLHGMRTLKLSLAQAVEYAMPYAAANAAHAGVAEFDLNLLPTGRSVHS